MSSLNSLTITGYKSIRDLRKFKLNNLNVLIGANGAGKSNFIGLFRLLNEMYQQNLQVYVQILICMVWLQTFQNLRKPSR